jgi:hypothetical protein
MRFLKTLTLNRRAIYDSRVALDTNNNFTLADSTVMTLPKSSSDLSSTQAEGMIRYNTSTHDIEVYQGTGGSATWRALRYREPGLITQQAIGTGNGTNTVFGPLNPQPATTAANGITWDLVQQAKQILVVVGNVLQVSGTNYVVILGENINNNGTATPGYPYINGQKYIQFTSGVPGLATPVVVLSGFDQ